MRAHAVAVICVAGCGFALPGATGMPPGDGSPEAGDAPADQMLFDPPCLHDAAYMARPQSSHRYRVVLTNLDYDGAIDRCTVDGAHLAVIDDADENAFVHALSTAELWLGYDDLTREGTFTWVTGATPPFTNFATGEPNDMGIEDCVYMLPPDGAWNDAPCAQPRPSVCECDATYQPPPTPACRELATGATTLDGRRYFLRTTAATWQAAEADCESIGATLPALSDLDEDTAVTNQLPGESWIGYNDITTEGTFVWSNGAPFGFENWNSNSPSTGTTGDSEDCAHLDFPNPDWNDTECASTKIYACECDPSPP